MAATATVDEPDRARLVAKSDEIERYRERNGNDFIDDEKSLHQIAEARNPDPVRLRDDLQKSRAMKTLEAEETATPFQVEDSELLEEIRAESEALAEEFGHKRLMVACGEHPLSDTDHLDERITTFVTFRDLYV